MPLAGNPLTASSTAEQMLVREAPLGSPVNVARAQAPVPARFIRAEFLRAFLAQRVTDHGPHATAACSFSLSDAWIIGPLDLSECGTGSSPLPHMTFTRCVFLAGINLTTAVLGGFQMDRSLIRSSGIMANGAHFSDSVQLKNSCFETSAVLEFSQTRIENSCLISDLAVYEPNQDMDKFVRFCDRASELYRDKYRSSTNFADFETCLSAYLEELFPEGNASEALGDIVRQRELACIADGKYIQNKGLQHIRFRSAHIAGDLKIEGTKVDSPERATTPEEELEGIIALEASSARIDGNFTLQRSVRFPSEIHGKVALDHATVAGDIRFRGVIISKRSKAYAIDATSVSINGFFLIEPSNGVPSRLEGSLGLLAARVGTQIVIEDAVIDANKEPHDDEIKAAIVADGIDVRGDCFIWNKDACLEAAVKGRIQLPGANIGGQLGIVGLTVCRSPGNPRAISARDIVVGGGIFFRAMGSRATNIQGQVWLTGATVDGDFEICGTKIQDEGKKDEYGEQADEAIYADGIKIKGDFLLAIRHPDKHQVPEAYEGCVLNGTVRLPGAEISGRLRIQGAQVVGPRGSAVLMSGSWVKGGVFLEPIKCSKCDKWVSTHFHGAFRLNQTRVGSKLSMRSVVIEAEANSIWANGATCDGTISIERCRLTGEVRLIGARIQGSLEIQGGILSAQTDGFALDCYNAAISDGVTLGPAKENAEAQRGREGLQIRGIVGLAYSQVGSLEIGDARLTDDKNTEEVSVEVDGQFRLDGIHVAEFTTISRIRLNCPALMTDTKISGWIMKRLRDWRVSDNRIILCARRADLGSMFYISLPQDTVGSVILDGAKVITLSDGDTKGWGNPPSGEGWKGESDQGGERMQGVRLGLNGFTYSYLNEEHKSGIIAHEGSGWRRIAAITKDWLDANSEKRNLRLEWLNKQFPDGKITAQNFFPLPYIQLAMVLRNQGYMRESNQVSGKRRQLQAMYGTEARLDRFLQRCFSFFFQHGYSSARALRTLTALLLLNFLFAFAGTHHFMGVLGYGHSSVIDKNRDAEDQQDWLKHIADAGKEPEDKGPVCQTPVTYALDEMLPGIHLERAGGCALARNTPRGYMLCHHVLLLLSWIGVATAALTFSGILRETSK